MKKIVFLSVVIFSIIASTSIPPETRVLDIAETDALLVFDVPKAACQNCQKVVEKGLMKEKAIKQSILNLHKKEVSIVYEPNEITASQIENKLNVLIDKMPCK